MDGPARGRPDAIAEPENARLGLGGAGNGARESGITIHDQAAPWACCAKGVTLYTNLT